MRVSAPTESQLDHYGGLLRLPCRNKTGHFSLAKLDDRWWFCTPEGHAFVSMSVGNIEPASKGTLDCHNQSAYDFLIRKYGEPPDFVSTWAWQTLKRMTSWGFNSVGQDSVGQVQPWYSCGTCPWPGGTQPIKLPYLAEDRPALYASINRDGYARGSTKDIMTGVNGNYNRYRAMLPDVFDPNLGEWWDGELGHRRVPSITANSPWLLGVFTDDSDDFMGSGPGSDFSTTPSGYNAADIGYLVVMAAPTQTYQPIARYGKHVIYPDTKVYSKADATNPSTACSIANPCSLRDYLWQKYRGSIATLNKAWGSNYTSFDSTGHQVSRELIGTGDGSTRVFTRALARHPISPNSLLMYMGQAAVAGDCAWFHPYQCRASGNTGSIGGLDDSLVDQSSSRIDYSTGQVTITFVNPPPRGTAISADYIYGGWMADGTGLMDESGDSPWIGRNHVCVEKSSSPYRVCVAGKEGPPNANPQTGADLDDWISEMSADYFKTMQAGLKRHSSVPYLGLDNIGGWSAPANKWFLKGAGPYIDGAFVQIYADRPNAAEGTAMYSYLTQYLGDVPLIDFITLDAGPDSAMSCHPGQYLPTQQARGQEYLTTVRTFLTTPSYNHDYPWVGFGWWAWQDFQGLNQGLVSIHDDAYDGKEAVKARGKDPWGYPTGGEDANYGDCLTAVKQANVLWYDLH